MLMHLDSIIVIGFTIYDGKECSPGVPCKSGQGKETGE